MRDLIKNRAIACTSVLCRWPKAAYNHVLGCWLGSRSAKVNPLNSPLLNLLTAALPVIGMWTVSVQVAKVLVLRKRHICISDFQVNPVVNIFGSAYSTTFLNHWVFVDLSKYKIQNIKYKLQNSEYKIRLLNLSSWPLGSCWPLPWPFLPPSKHFLVLSSSSSINLLERKE